MTTTALASYADITEDDFIEVEWVQGSGYGWALIEKPDSRANRASGCSYAVLLVNEDALPLAVLRTFAQPPSREFTDGITGAILNGRGEALQKLGAAIPDPHAALHEPGTLGEYLHAANIPGVPCPDHRED